MTALDDRTSAPPRAPYDDSSERQTATPPRAPRDESPEGLAAAHARTRRGSRLGLRRWLSALDRRMGEVYARLARSPEAVAARPLAAEWLLDNQHVIQEALQQVEESLPWRFHRELPALAEGSLAGKTRVYALARALVERGDGHVELDVAPRFLAAYQELAPLSMGELWALPAMLRLVVLEDLVTEAERLFADPADAATESDPSRIPVYILGLRELATQDWRTFFEEASRVEALLRADPAGVYSQMDFATRDAYRKAVERIAREGGRRDGEGEEAVARAALELSGERAGDGRRGHVGWWLVDCGKAELPARLGLRASALSSLARRITARSVGLYLASVAFAVAALLAGVLAYAARTDASLLQTAALLLVTAVPAVTVAVAYVNWIVTHAVGPRLLPKLDTDALDGERHRTIVVVPCVLTGVEDVRQQLRELEINYLGNSSPLLSYALLVDLADAAVQHLEGDGALVEAARLGIEKLNERHRRPEWEPFHLLHRERRWNGRENLWMGWERKRGKLHELNRLLLGGEDTSFVGDGRLPTPRPFHYVITVDADTFLPPTAALRLVAALAHPLNEPELDARGAVVGGYTVLQPRLETLPASARSSAFARVFEADTGLDLYTHAVSDVYQDLAGEGIFAGKGIYRVDAFERSLEARVPENALLSHDLFEGLLGRAGLVSDVALFEHFPAHVLTYMRRLHRWVRGDWQLLPWLAARVPAFGGRRIRHGLSGLDRWKIFDNLRRSLLAPSLLALLVADWLWLPGPPWAWTLVAAAVLATPIFLQGATTVNQVVRARRVRETVGPTLEPPGLWQGLRSLGNDAWRLFLGIAFLPFEAYVVVDAIVRTLWRLAVSRRRLLEWTTAAHAAQAMGRRASALFVWRSMAAAPLLALAILGAVALIRPAALPRALPFLLLWLVAPEIAHRVSRPRQPPAALPAFLAPDRAALRRLARRTWLYFQHFIGPENSWLPPDNFQEEPGRIVARRTSPTNIGLSLLSALAAHDLGYAGTRTLAATLRNTFDGLERLERYRGHFLNWYDTRALAALTPRYVSTVDSGNLAACLLTLSTATDALTQAPILPRRLARGFLDTLALVEETVRRVEESEAGSKPEATGSRRDTQSGAPPGRPSIEAASTRIRERVTAAAEEPSGLAAALAEVSGSLLPKLESLVVGLVVSAPVEIEPALVRELRIWLAALREDLVLWQKEVEALAPWIAFLGRSPALYAREDFGAAAAWHALRTALPVRPPLGRAPKACRRARKRLAQLEAAVEKEAETGAGRIPGAGAARIPDDVIEEARSWNAGLAEALELGIRNNETLLADLREVSAVAERLVAEMDFDFLFDRRRCLFHIGYDVTAGSPDPNYYDLLASEARLASFVAIAKGNVPPAHWLHLGRPFARVDGTRALLSWGGTMFEYLMPSLLMRHPGATLLGLSSRAAVDRQIAYGTEVDAPWGISESGFAELDPRANYRYAAFGVPGLGLKRDLGRRLVVSPYASLLALPFRPRAVEKNIEALERLGMLGRYGLFEALDLGRAELPREPRIVQSYMTHHQGMILLALVNALRDRTMVARFHAHPLVATAEYLLHERIPWHAPLRVPVAADGWRRPAMLRTAHAEGWPVPRHPVLPQLHVLSNGRFSVWITASGASGCRWRDVALTRWRPDPTVQGTGQRLYVQDTSSGAFWSVGRDPVPEPGQNDVVRFAPHAVQFSRRRRGIGVKMEVTVPPADDLEIRRVRLVNHAGRTRRLALVTYAEPVLASPADDRRHPAFQKLFLETAWLPEHRALLVKRRLGSAADEPLYLLHALLYGPDVEGRVTFETDRARFLGRFGSARRPAALAAGALPLSGTAGSTVDPVMALRCRVELAPRAEAELVFVTVAGRSRAEVLAPLESYRSAARVEWAFRQARTRSEQELQELGVVSHQAREMQELLSALLHPSHALRAEPDTLAANRLSRRGLWRHGISGDHPILLVRVGRPEDAPVAREALLAHAFWRARRVEFDVVIVNEESVGYAQPLQERLEALIAETEGGAWRDQRAGIFLLRGAKLEAADRTLLASAAAVLLDASRGSLARQLERLREQPLELPGFVPMPSSPIESEPAIPWKRRSDLRADNGLGGFSGDGREYVIELAGDRATPAPWCNVIANPGFGFLVSESGGGFTWSAHSAENRLTPWRNDPVVDEPGEALYLRDEETGEIWSPTPQPAGRSGGASSSPAGELSDGTAGGLSGGTGSDAAYRVRHGAGYTVFEHHRHGLEQQLTLFAAREEPVKVVHLRVENRWSRPRRITATYYAEWVLGEAREDTLAHIVPDYDHATGALLARNTFHATFDERVAFLAASREPHGLTTDRREFLGADGTLRRPAALSRIGLSGTVRPGTDPCAALQVHLDLGPGETQEVHFLLGQGVDRDHAVSLVSRFRDPAAVAAERERVDELWDGLLGAVSVQTPDAAMDLMLNRWLLYQTLACRVWGRSALYQSSGAFGFRDQLQDVLPLVHGAPHLARAHLLESARHQFEEGDVLHWWHPPASEGVRTRCSDDMLWLPYATAAYVRSTGDAGILEEEVPYLAAEPLRPDEHDRYMRFESGTSGSLYEHCLRAIERGDTAGRHGLPLMGAHDWNDGLNRVGIGGEGESVWLGWFLRAVFLAFAPLCESRGDGARAATMRDRADVLAGAVEASAWDGRWYLRAWYDDGSTLGASQDLEARIDSLPQSWAVLAGGDPDRAGKAMDSVLEHLLRGDPNLCCLFWPPFDRTPRDPGYVKGYPPGVRENGGQYSHAAAWVGWAFAQRGDGDRAHAVFDLLNPVRRAETPAEVELYRVEPYVIAADVYSHPPHVGRGGWTWYTGSAGWTWRLGVEAILGLRREVGGLRIDPCIPHEWPGFQAVYRVGRTSWTVRVENPDRVSRGVRGATVDGTALQGGVVPLEDDGGEHVVVVRMGAGSPQARSRQ